MRRSSAGDASGVARTAPYLFNEKAMAKVFRAKMLAAIEAAGIGLPACYPREWVAHCQSVGSGEKALISLGRYLYRGVIREQDILACENGRVSFRAEVRSKPLQATAQGAATDALLVLWRRDGDRQDADSLDIARSRRRHARRRGRHLTM
jgi:hypothetical protein